MEPAPPTQDDVVVSIAHDVSDEIIEKIENRLREAEQEPCWQRANFTIVRGNHTWIHDCADRECGELLADITALIYGSGQP